MLQERFGVSSTPIREALTRLTQEQLISYYSNVGVSVVSLDRRDIQEIFQFMGDLDSLAVQYASTYPDQTKLIHEMDENISYMKCSSYDSPEWKQLSDQFHLLFYRYCRNSRLVRTAEQMRGQLSILAYQYEQFPNNQEQIFQEHQKIADAYRQQDYSHAVKLMKEHLMHSLEYAYDL